MVILKSEHDPFAHSPERRNLLAFKIGDGRHSRAEQEGAGEEYLFQRLVQNASAQRVEINGDIREFGHAGE
jgi:hypothetical protein